MPIILSYLVIPLVFLLLVVNVYFRLKIIKQYKYLRTKDVSVDPMVMMKKSTREAYLREVKPDHGHELEQFAKTLNNLLRFVIIGFVLIFISFAFIYFNQNPSN